MKENSFMIMTLSLYNMIDFINNNKALTPPYKFDLSNGLVYDTVVSKVESYPDTAFFHQAVLASGSEYSEDSLLRKVLFLDCRGIFRGETDDRDDDGDAKNKDPLLTDIAGNIFVKGILLRFGENDPEYSLYMPFDKSNSMSRESRITFVEAAPGGFRKKLDERICLGIDFEKIKDNVETSKFYAYRGLMLTTAKRVELSSFIGTETATDIRNAARALASAFIVVEIEKKPYGSDYDVITATEETPNVWKRQIETITPKDGKYPDRYDGEGMIGREASCVLNAAFRKERLLACFRSTVSLILREMGLGKSDVDRAVGSIDESCISGFYGRGASLSGVRAAAVKIADEAAGKDTDGLFDTEPYNGYLISLTRRINESRLSSYQVRLPFCKGMLHEADFHKFFKEELELSDDAVLRDIYGRERKLSDAKIILTKSMFKCAKWLDRYRDGDGTISCGDEIFDDPMEFYFYQCLRYGHGLYIGNTNAMLRNDGTVKLNYQFLSTMALSNGEIELLAKKQFDTAAESAKRKMLFDVDSPETGPSDSVSLNEERSPWALAYALCATERERNNLLRDSKVRGMLRGTVESLKREAAIGKILVEGECRFLSCDLLALLIDISLLVKDIDGKVKDRITDIRSRYTIRTGHYYMPDMKSKLPREAFSAVLRNPHLSRNEETVAKRGYEKTGSEKKYYKTYFSHLNGIVMFPYDSLIPMAVGGADFDGDLVKIVHDPIIVGAVKRGVYDDKLRRTLHVIDIPKAGGISRKLSDCFASGYSSEYGCPTDFETIRNTFNSRVGQISNMAVRFAKRDSKNSLAGAEDHGNTDAAECTIITGLEIDAAKNGRRPSFSAIKQRLKELRETDPNEVDQKDYFISFKEHFSALPKFGRNWRSEKTSKGDWQINYDQKRYFLVRKTEEDDTFAPIDSLPWLYFEHADNKGSAADVKETKAAGRIYKFDKFDEEALKEQKTALININRAYSAVLRQASADGKNARISKNSKYGKKIKDILRLRYDSLYVPVSVSADGGVKQTVLDVFASTYGAVRGRFAGEKREAAIRDIDGVIEKMRSEHWEIMDDAAKERFIGENGLLSQQGDVQDKEDQRRLLTNFSYGGYKILYYILKSVKCELIEPDYQTDGERAEYETDGGADTDMRQTPEYPNDDGEEDENPYIRRYTDIYRRAMRKKESRKDWHDRLIRRCKSDIAQLFGDEGVNWQYVIKVIYGQRKSGAADPAGDFFWNIIPAEVIAENINTGTDGSKDQVEAQNNA